MDGTWNPEGGWESSKRWDAGGFVVEFVIRHNADISIRGRLKNEKSFDGYAYEFSNMCRSEKEAKDLINDTVSFIYSKKKNMEFEGMDCSSFLEYVRNSLMETYGSKNAVKPLTCVKHNMEEGYDYVDFRTFLSSKGKDTSTVKHLKTVAVNSDDVDFKAEMYSCTENGKDYNVLGFNSRKEKANHYCYFNGSFGSFSADYFVRQFMDNRAEKNGKYILYFEGRRTGNVLSVNEWSEKEETRMIMEAKRMGANMVYLGNFSRENLDAEIEKQKKVWEGYTGKEVAVERPQKGRGRGR